MQVLGLCSIQYIFFFLVLCFKADCSGLSRLTTDTRIAEPSKQVGSDLHLILTGSEAGWMILAHRPRSIWSKPDTVRTKLDLGWFYTIWSGLVMI